MVDLPHKPRLLADLGESTRTIGVAGSRESACVAFDFDGLLVDTDRIWRSAITDMLRDHGADAGDDARARFDGLSLWQVGPVLEELIGRRGAGRSLTDDLVEHAIQYADRVSFMEGALAVLRRSVRLTSVAVVSNGSRALITRVLRREGLLRRIVVVTAADVCHPKPWPCPYAIAASSLGCATSELYVMEDSQPGADSAIAAGAVVIGVSDKVELKGVWRHVRCIAAAEKLLPLG